MISKQDQDTRKCFKASRQAKTALSRNFQDQDKNQEFFYCLTVFDLPDRKNISDYS